MSSASIYAHIQQTKHEISISEDEIRRLSKIIDLQCTDYDGFLHQKSKFELIVEEKIVRSRNILQFSKTNSVVRRFEQDTADLISEAKAAAQMDSLERIRATMYQEIQANELALESEKNRCNSLYSQLSVLQQQHSAALEHEARAAAEAAAAQRRPAR